MKVKNEFLKGGSFKIFKRGSFILKLKDGCQIILAEVMNNIIYYVMS